MLSWPDDVLANVGFGMQMRDDDFTQRMEKAFNVCLAATSADPLRQEAGKVKDVMDQMELSAARHFGQLLEAARREFPQGDWFSEPWYQGIATRANADPNTKTAGDLATTFSAYHDFERIKLATALGNKNYNAEKHKNDLFDAEQLVYLGSPELCFLTCDRGFARVNGSAQFAQIAIVSLDEISDAQKVEALLRKQIAAV